VPPGQEQNFQHLRIEKISRNFGATAALTGLDMTIRSGEFIALLGPSGCGKSTALNCIAGPGLQLQGMVQEYLTSKRAVIAIRPDNIAIELAQRKINEVPPRNVIYGQAEIVEYCGRDYLVDVLAESGALLHARTPRRIVTGDRLRLAVPPERVLTFSPA
jgi:ABC-type sugar transport system ATPase subunit